MVFPNKIDADTVVVHIWHFQKMRNHDVVWEIGIDEISDWTIYKVLVEEEVYFQVRNVNFLVRKEVVSVRPTLKDEVVRIEGIKGIVPIDSRSNNPY